MSDVRVLDQGRSAGSRFFIVFASVFGYMLLWFVPVVPITLWLQDIPEAGVGLAAAVFLLFTVTLFPFMNAVARRVFFFEGVGDALPGDSLRADLLRVNEFDAPVVVEERDDRLVFTWRYVDAKWWEILAKTGLRKVYQLHVKLDAENREARFIDVMKSVTWRSGPDSVRLWGGCFRGINFTYEFGKQWGIRENFTLGKIYDFTFSPSEIRNPVLNTILRSGWDVRFTLW